MVILLTVLHIVVCFLLIAVILLQVGKGHGLTGGGFGDSNTASSIFGTKTGAFLSKATTVVAVVFILTTLSLDAIQLHKSKSLFQSKGSRDLEGFDMEKMKATLEKIKQEAQEKEAQAKQISENLKQQESTRDAQAVTQVVKK